MSPGQSVLQPDSTPLLYAERSDDGLQGEVHQVEPIGDLEPDSDYEHLVARTVGSLHGLDFSWSGVSVLLRRG